MRVPPAVFIARPAGSVAEKRHGALQVRVVRTRLPTRRTPWHLFAAALRREGRFDGVVVVVRNEAFRHHPEHLGRRRQHREEQLEHDVAVAKREGEASRVLPAERAEGPIDPGFGLILRPRA
jgi:hypothetical protein